MAKKGKLEDGEREDGTVKTDIEYFRERVSYWLARFGMGSWEVDCKHEKLNDRTFATVDMCGVARNAMIKLNETFGMFPSDEDSLDRTARHEVIEIVLYDLSTSARSFFGDDYVFGLTHQVIHRIERALDTE